MNKKVLIMLTVVTRNLNTNAIIIFCFSRAYRSIGFVKCKRCAVKNL